MHTVRVVTEIAAAIDRCFDFARDVDAHVRSAGESGEQIVAGRLSGMLELGDSVTFEATHFGIRQRLESRITAFDRPHFFQDRMVRGAFRFLEHDHLFEPLPNGQTRMIDVLRFRAPLAFVGWPVGHFLIAPHLRRFLIQRGRALKAMAEMSASQARE